MPEYLVTLRNGSKVRVRAESKAEAESNVRAQLRSLASHQQNPAIKREFLARSKVMPGRTTSYTHGVDKPYGE